MTGKPTIGRKTLNILSNLDGKRRYTELKTTAEERKGWQELNRSVTQDSCFSADDLGREKQRDSYFRRFLINTMLLCCKITITITP